MEGAVFSDFLQEEMASSKKKSGVFRSLYDGFVEQIGFYDLITCW